MEELEGWRQEINEINLQILNLIGKRMEVVKKIGDYKKQRNLPIMDNGREQKIYETLDRLAEEKGLDKEFVRKVFEVLIEQAKKEEAQ